MKLIILNESQAQRLRDIVSDKQDRIAEAHSKAEKAGATARAKGLWDSLKFWDEIDRAIRDAKEAAPSVQTMLVNSHERAEWLRMADDARAKGFQIIANRYEAAARETHPMLLTRFDDLQANYRKWLNGGFASGAQTKGAK